MIGRYFTVVSLVPSAVFTAYLALLVRSKAWGHGHVDFAAAVNNVQLKDLAIFGAGSLLTAMTLHPLQSAVIQFFEGFWGLSKFARKLALANTNRHRHRAATLDRAARRSARKAEPGPGQPPYAERLTATRAQVASWLTSREAWRLHGNYPPELQDVMPTLLGNVLRRYEVLAGAPYGLNSIDTVPRLIQVADARDVAYVHNQRMQMDLALRTAALALVATVLTLIFMWYQGLWLFLSLVPYSVAYLTYRGAVVVAREYGTALAVLVDLNRFVLYERMRVPLPDDSEEEKENNVRLATLFRLDNIDVRKRLDEVYLDYVHQPSPESSSRPNMDHENKDTATNSKNDSADLGGSKPA